MPTVFNAWSQHDTGLSLVLDNIKTTNINIQEYVQCQWWYPTLSNWEFAESIFPAGFVGQGVLNEDPPIWLNRFRPPPLVLLVLPLPENEFGKVII
jgi:hypothetical protein